MGWFDEQIRQRKRNDDEAFADSFANMASAVLGRKGARGLSDESTLTKNAIDEILRFYHVKSRDVPESIKDVNGQLEYLMRPYGIMRRTVRLSDGWYKDAVGAMLGRFREDGRAVALIPTGLPGYSWFDEKTGKRRRVAKSNCHLFEDDAIAFYKPFPLKKMGLGTLTKYIVQTLSVADYLLVALAALGVSLVGLFSPALNKLLFGEVLSSGSVRLLAAIAVFMVCVSVSSLLLSAVKSMILARINTKMGVAVQAATMVRVLSLPADFFKEYSAGELSSRTAYINALCDMLVSAALGTGLTSLFSLIYLSQVLAYAPALVVPALLVTLVTVLFSLVSSLAQMRISEKQMALAGKESGMTYALISGVQKIKLTGAEKRAFAR